MLGIVVPETCWAYKKYNKIISGIWLVFILQCCDFVATPAIKCQISWDKCALKMASQLQICTVNRVVVDLCSENMNAVLPRG